MSHFFLVASHFLLPLAFYADADGDGYGDAATSVEACAAPAGFVEDGTDCDDTDAAVNPGVEEIPGNGIDDDCNPETPDEEPCFTCTGILWAPPCTPDNIGNELFYHPHCDETMFVQCDAFGQCWNMPCAPGTVWCQEWYTCVPPGVC